MPNNNRQQGTATELASTLNIKYTQALRLVRMLPPDQLAWFLLDTRVRHFSWSGREDEKFAAGLVEAMIATGSVSVKAREEETDSVINLWSRCRSLTLHRRATILAAAGAPLCLRLADLIPGDQLNLVPLWRDLEVDGPAGAQGFATVEATELVNLNAGQDEPGVNLHTNQGSYAFAAWRQVEVVLGDGRCDVCGAPHSGKVACRECERRKVTHPRWSSSPAARHLTLVS